MLDPNPAAPVLYPKSCTMNSYFPPQMFIETLHTYESFKINTTPGRNWSHDDLRCMRTLWHCCAITNDLIHICWLPTQMSQLPTTGTHPNWLTCGRTILIMKYPKKGTPPSNNRPPPVRGRHQAVSQEWVRHQLLIVGMSFGQMQTYGGQKRKDDRGRRNGVTRGQNNTHTGQVPWYPSVQWELG